MLMEYATISGGFLYHPYKSEHSGAYLVFFESPLRKPSLMGGIRPYAPHHYVKSSVNPSIVCAKV